MQRDQARAKLFGHKPTTRIGRYRVVDTLGEGGMGVVFSAVDEDLDRKIALKVLRASSGSGLERRLQREARAMAKLSHPNVVTVHEVSVVSGRVCVAMEFVAGSTLRTWLTQARPLRQICDVFAQTARGLIAAHEVGIVHRDLKPDNVMVGDDGRVRVLDFGLAKTIGELQGDDGSAITDGAQASRDGDSGSSEDLERLTVTGAVMGTPRYMAPEQFLAEDCDARTDQFAFCLALYEAVYRQHAFLGSTVRAIGKAVVGGELQDPPTDHSVPEPLADAIRRGLQVDADERYPSMTALLDVLSPAAGERVDDGSKAAQAVPSHGRGLGRASFFVGFVVVAAISVGAIAFTNREPPPRQPVATTADDELLLIDRLYVGGQEKYAVGDFAGAANDWGLMLDRVPEAAANRASRQLVVLNALQAFQDAYEHKPNADGSKNPRFLDMGRRLGTQYVDQFRREYGDTAVVAAQVVEKLKQLDDLGEAAAKAQASLSAVMPPPAGTSSTPEVEATPPRSKRRRSRVSPKAKMSDGAPLVDRDPQPAKQETDLEAVGR